jgi:nitrogen-specific signal transduction histidine kinase/ActR/RegA family two-component response regulator
MKIDGEIRHYHNIIKPIVDQGEISGILGINIDITDRKRSDADRQRVQKLESIGTMAGGLAHDFNNHLMGILGNISLVAEKTAADDERLPLLREAEAACQQARSLTQQLLAFAKRGKPILAPTDIEALLKETAQLALSRSQCRWELSCADDLSAALVDADQISQVVNNLLINSTQAMPGGGTIRISARNRLIASSSRAISAGRYVEVLIEDEGMGISAEHLQQVFDPYFSTKTAGQGLGMSVVYSIVKKHGGSIRISSELEEGTCVSLLLPAASVSPKLRIVEPSGVRHGRGHVLVMEDDEYVLKATCLMLEHLGYTATATSSCREAVALFERAWKTERPYDMAILDLTVPGGAGGLECLSKLRAIDPVVKAVVSSGYSNDPVLADHTRYGFAGFLTKPFKIGVLSRVLKGVMSGDEAT